MHLLWAVLASLYPPMSPPFVKLAEGGRSLCAIVVEGGTGEAGRFAASELASYIEKISGAKPPVVGEVPEGAVPLRLSIERSLGLETVLIECDGRAVEIKGGDERGLIYATYAFLEECLGVRWFMPGPLGEVVPQARTLKVGRFRRLERPDFEIRWVGWGAWALRNRMNVGVPFGIRQVLPGHTFSKIVPPEEFFKAHPEYFSLVRGRRRPSQLCTSNDELVALVVARLREVLDRNPGATIVGLCPNDGLGFCECERCRALDEEGRPTVEEVNRRYLQMGPERYGALSRRLLIFDNRVARALAETHPGVLVRCFFYNPYLQPPDDPSIRAEDNLLAEICHNTCHAHPFAEGACPRNLLFRRFLERWAEICKRWMVYEYYQKGAAMGLPWPVVHCIVKDIPFLKKLGASGLYTQYSRQEILAPNFYVAAKLLWDADLDPEALLSDFFEKFFGPAAPEMREVFEILEAKVARSRLHPCGMSDTKFLFVEEWFDEGTISRCLERISRAKSKARNSPAVLRRISAWEATLRYARLMRDYLLEVRRLERAGVSEGDEKALERARSLARRVREFVERQDPSIVPRRHKFRDRLFLNPSALLRRLRRPLGNAW